MEIQAMFQPPLLIIFSLLFTQSLTMEPGGLLEYNIKKEVTCRGTENSPERDSFPGESLHIKKENGDRLIESGVMDDPQFVS